MIVVFSGIHIPIWTGNDKLLIASLGFYFSSDTSQWFYYVLGINEHNLFQEAWKSSSTIHGVSKSFKLEDKNIVCLCYEEENVTWKL